MYKDDGLSCFHNFSVPESEKIKRKFCEIFKQNGLNISVECNLQITDFLDVTFDLRTGKYYSYMNCYLLTSNQIIYHLSLSKFQPWSVKKISNISCDKECFDKLPPDYNKALRNSGFNEKVKFTPQTPQRKKVNRNILWFNLPFSCNVMINIDNIFPQILDKHFPKHNKYYKLFNRSNVKISHSCM